MRTISGDLIALAKAGQFDLIAHGCNCCHVMGAGLAAQIKRHFPEAYAADLATPYGEAGKLGTCSVAVVQGGGAPLTVVNAYTQLAPSLGAGVDVDYAALERSMRWIGARFSDHRIGLPQIGAGLAGGDWVRIRGIIADALAGADVTIVAYKG